MQVFFESPIASCSIPSLVIFDTLKYWRNVGGVWRVGGATGDRTDPRLFAGGGFGPDLGPSFIPIALRIDGRIGGQDTAVELFVGQSQPGRPLVGGIGQRPLF